MWGYTAHGREKTVPNDVAIAKVIFRIQAKQNFVNRKKAKQIIIKPVDAVNFFQYVGRHIVFTMVLRVFHFFNFFSDYLYN